MTKKKYNLANYTIKAKRKINGWTLVHQLGKGGNGEVWLCRNANKEKHAIKFLKWGGGDSYKRFYDETEFMEHYAGTMGVIPIVDKYVPEYSKRYDNLDLPFYYVMPLASPIEELIEQMTFDVKIHVIMSLLHILAELHGKGIAHRDIKPANILQYNGEYVFSDFGLVFFQNKTSKTPPGAKIGARTTIAPQMQRNALTADKYKADVYSMAKTIWMILTGDMKSFDGQYKINSAFGLRQIMKEEGVYWYPLEKLLIQCTDLNESARPTADELKRGFTEWLDINGNWERQNLIQWQEVQEQLFPSYVPSHSEWTDVDDIISILNLVGQYDSLNHLFFPDGGGLDLTGASKSNEQGCIELYLDGVVHIVKPKCLSYEYIEKSCEWNYFHLELDELQAVTPDFPSEYYCEELCEIASEYLPLEVMDAMTPKDAKIKPRHIVRYLKGRLIAFHKNSIYNLLIANYNGEHNRYTALDFRQYIVQQAERFEAKQ